LSPRAWVAIVSANRPFLHTSLSFLLHKTCSHYHLVLSYQTTIHLAFEELNFPSKLFIPCVHVCYPKALLNFVAFPLPLPLLDWSVFNQFSKTIAVISFTIFPFFSLRSVNSKGREICSSCFSKPSKQCELEESPRKTTIDHYQPPIEVFLHFFS
jgi:hypothetical protein